MWLIRKYPEKRHAYITYSLGRARRIAKKVKKLLAGSGIVVGGTLDAMELPGGGQCIFTSIDGGITGEPVDGVAIIDDPFKNRKEVDSQARRGVVEDSYRDAIETRVHPGASIFLLATRWHPNDLSGTLIAEGWEYINLPAIAEGSSDPNGREPGEPLFPGMWPLEALERKRKAVGDFTWAALYQGRPRPRGGKVFHEPTYYEKLPMQFRGGFGLDLAYSAKTSSDWSICVEMWREEAQQKAGLPKFYIRWVDRKQVEAPLFTLTLKARHALHKAWRFFWRRAGTEKGSASFLKKANLPIDEQTPPGDKFVCAQEYAAAWNDGRVLVPSEDAFAGDLTFSRGGPLDEWLYAFLDVHANFTGVGNEKDDDVDAGATIFDNLNRGVPSAKPRELPSLRI